MTDMAQLMAGWEGPRRATVTGVGQRLKHTLRELGWDVSIIPAPAGDLAGWPGVPDRSLDVVVCDHAFTGLHHAEKRLALARLARALTQTGVLLVLEPIVPERPFGWSPAALLRRASYRLARGVTTTSGPASAQFWLTALRHAGFSDVELLPTSNHAAVLRARQ